MIITNGIASWMHMLSSALKPNWDRSATTSKHLILWYRLQPQFGISLVPMQTQYLIACSMQVHVWRGRAWEIWSHVGMSGRQAVDTWGVVPDHNNSCFTLTHCWCHKQQCCCCLKNFLASSLRTDTTWKGFDILCWAWPPCVSTVCLPKVTAHYQISQAFFPSVFTYCRCSNTGDGNSLETRVVWHEVSS